MLAVPAIQMVKTFSIKPFWKSDPNKERLEKMPSATLVGNEEYLCNSPNTI